MRKMSASASFSNGHAGFGRTVFDPKTGQGGKIEYAAYAAAVTRRSSQVDADTAGVAGNRDQVGVAGQPNVPRLPPVSMRKSAPSLGFIPDRDSMILAHV